MKTNTKIFSILRNQRGQVLPMIAVAMMAILGMSALVCDVGRALYCYRQLQNSANAAALAGAQQLPNSSATAQVAAYSAQTGDKNATAQMSSVSMVAGYPQLLCLETLKSQGMACSAPDGANAVRVEEQVTVPMIFASLFGQKTITLKAEATASASGSGAAPANVLIVLDTTASMNTQDTGECGNTRIYCAIQGVQVLLANLSPCGSQTSCGSISNGNVTNPVDEVALDTFPGLTTSSQTVNDTNCSGNNPAISIYSYPTAPIYQIVPFSSDYRTSDGTSSLNGSSLLVDAVGGKSNCPGMQAPGGEGTYYAGVIYAAEAQLEASARSNAQNVMIILSDGDANATSAHMTSTNNNGTYPSTADQCHQAITAAQYATSRGTLVYTIAYGASSSGCTTDTPNISPCAAMEAMASAPQYFYSDYTAAQNNGQCISASQSITSLSGIFKAISSGAGMSAPRLIPNSVT